VRAPRTPVCCGSREDGRSVSGARRACRGGVAWPRCWSPATTTPTARNVPHSRGAVRGSRCDQSVGALRRVVHNFVPRPGTELVAAGKPQHRTPSSEVPASPGISATRLRDCPSPRVSGPSWRPHDCVRRHSWSGAPGSCRSTATSRTCALVRVGAENLARSSPQPGDKDDPQPTRWTGSPPSDRPQDFTATSSSEGAAGVRHAAPYGLGAGTPRHCPRTRDPISQIADRTRRTHHRSSMSCRQETVRCDRAHAPHPGDDVAEKLMDRQQKSITDDRSTARLPGKTSGAGGARTHDLTDYESISSPGRSTPPGLMAILVRTRKTQEARLGAS
jgi:hypothetical protein